MVSPAVGLLTFDSFFSVLGVISGRFEFVLRILSATMSDLGVIVHFGFFGAMSCLGTIFPSFNSF